MRKVYNARFQINGSGVKLIKKKKKPMMLEFPYRNKFDY